MLKEIPSGLQSLHIDTLTLSPTRVNWVEKQSNCEQSHLEAPQCGYLSLGMERCRWGAQVVTFKKL